MIINKPPHAIVLDLFMPEMDGFAILENLRTNSNLENIPVILISGTELTSDQQFKLKSFGNKLLQLGSLEEDELLNTLEYALNQVNH